MATPAPAYQGNGSYVFVSYAHADEATVYDEITALQNRNINVWYDTTGISAGAEWSNEIAQAIKGASSFLFFITPRSVASEHCRREVNFAQNQGIPVVVVHLEETDVPDGLSLSLDNRQAILRYRQTPATYQTSLLRALRRDTAEPVQSDTQSIASAIGTPDRTSSRRWPLPLAVAAVLAIATSTWIWLDRPGQEPGTRQSIAVLPFSDLSASGDQQHFGDGIAEEILD
ncbi:MAG: TIR domain-containing protein, partial [Pseudomonadota bacterium]